MDLSLKLHKGKAEMPVVLLIHGLGMNNNFWVDPEKCTVLGGLAPLTIFLADTAAKANYAFSFGYVDPQTQGLWHSLKAAGFSLAAWPQSQPLGPIQIAIAELKTVLAAIRHQWPGKTISLVGHSRGGLIARRFLLDEAENDIDGLITLCTPHKGTGLAKFSRFLRPAGIVLEKLIAGKSKATLTKALNRLTIFLQSPAIDELTPESEFMASLQNPLPQHLRKLTFGGTSPALFQVTVRLPTGNHKSFILPDILAGIIPAGHLPGELTPGLGDGLVMAESAKLADAIHYDFPVNHVKAAYDSKIHAKIIEFLLSKDKFQ